MRVAFQHVHGAHLGEVSPLNSRRERTRFNLPVIVEGGGHVHFVEQGGARNLLKLRDAKVFEAAEDKRAFLREHGRKSREWVFRMNCVLLLLADSSSKVAIHERRAG